MNLGKYFIWSPGKKNEPALTTLSSEFDMISCMELIQYFWPNIMEAEVTIFFGFMNDYYTMHSKIPKSLDKWTKSLDPWTIAQIPKQSGETLDGWQVWGFSTSHPYLKQNASIHAVA